jgi:hypothetical protein
LIRGVVRPFESLWALVWWQTAAGIGTALLTWHLLVHRLAVPRRVATVGTCLLAIEPAQLSYERMVLAESFGLLAFALFVAAAAAYIASGRWWWLPLVALAGLAAATLRLNYVPVVLVISVIAPLLRALQERQLRALWEGQTLRVAQRAGSVPPSRTSVPPSRTSVPPSRTSPWRNPSWRQTVVHTAIAVASVVVTHGTFQQWVALIFDAPPGYIARAGFMQLGLVMPLVEPEHLERVGLPRDFAQHLRFRLDDPDARMPHQWAPGGFVRTLRERGIPVEDVARPLARMALTDDPFGLVRMGVHTVGNYFRREGIRHALDNDLGRRVIPHEILWTLREIWHYDASGLWTRTTAISWYFEKGTWSLVLWLFVLAPLGIANAIALWRTPLRAQAVLVGLIAIGLVLAHVLFVPVAFYRYLHPLPVFVLINLLPLVAGSYATQVTLCVPCKEGQPSAPPLPDA